MTFPTYLTTCFFPHLLLSRTSAVAACDQKKPIMKEGTSERAAADSPSHRGLGEGRVEERYFRKAPSSPSQLPFHLCPGTEWDLLSQELVHRLPRMAEVSPPCEPTGFSGSSSCPW